MSGSFSLQHLPAAQLLDLRLLRQTGAVTVLNLRLANVSLPALKTVAGGGISVTASPLMQSFALPNCTAIAGPLVVSVSAGVLCASRARCVVAGAAVPSSVSMHCPCTARALSSHSLNDVVFSASQNNVDLLRLTLPQLAVGVTTVTLSDCAKLASIDLKRLQTTAGTVTVSECMPYVRSRRSACR